MIPFLVGAAGLGAAVLGLGGHLDAQDTNERAVRRVEEAQELYNSACSSLAYEKKQAEESLLKLGYQKKYILETSMQQFIRSYEKIQEIDLRESQGLNEIRNLKITPEEIREINVMMSSIEPSLASGTAGAATGVALSLAANGSLPIVAGSLSVAGEMLVAGNIAAATSIAGTTAIAAVTTTPLAAIAAPVLLFTGISSSIKADENMEKANAKYREVELAVEKINTEILLCKSISKNSEMMVQLLIDLNKIFLECTCLLEGIINRKTGFLDKKVFKTKGFSENERKVLAVTGSLAKAIKAVIDTPLLNSLGKIDEAFYDNYAEQKELLPKRQKEVIDITSQKYKTKKAAYYSSTPSSTESSKPNYSAKKKSDKTLLYYAGRVLYWVFAAGFFLAGTESILNGTFFVGVLMLIMAYVSVKKIDLSEKIAWAILLLLLYGGSIVVSFIGETVNSVVAPVTATEIVEETEKTEEVDNPGVNVVMNENEEENIENKVTVDDVVVSEKDENSSIVQNEKIEEDVVKSVQSEEIIISSEKESNDISQNTAVSNIVGSGTISNDISWIFDKQGVLTYSGNGAIPDGKIYNEIEENGYVRSVTGDAKKIVIEEGITAIGMRAFEHTNATVIELPTSLTRINNAAFTSAYYLESIVIPKNVSYIGHNVFTYCGNLKTVTIYNPEIKIESGTFDWSNPEMVLQAPSGSTVETYAAEQGIKFSPI